MNVNMHSHGMRPFKRHILQNLFRSTRRVTVSWIEDLFVLSRLMLYKYRDTEVQAASPGDLSNHVSLVLGCQGRMGKMPFADLLSV